MVEVEMEHRSLGRSGLRVSLVGLGCNGFNDLEKARDVYGAARDCGINFFDLADMYGGPGGVSEAIMGELSQGHRDQIILATKGGFATDGSFRAMGASRRYLVQAVEASLKRLKTDYIDLYQIHAPDPLTPLDETLRALDDLIRQGKIRYIGASNYAGWQLVDAMWIAETNKISRFISSQNEYNLLARGIETTTLPAMQRAGVGLLPYFPLASGLLTGKVTKDAPPAPGTRLTMGGLPSKVLNDTNVQKAEVLKALAEERGRTLVELAFGWLASRPETSSIIAGASRGDQVRANAASAGWTLDSDLLAKIDAITL